MKTSLFGLLICLAASCALVGGRALGGTTERVSVSSAGEQGDFGSDGGSISADGRYVAFGSGASNLVPADTNPEGDVFVHDRQTGETERVSVSSGGEQGNHVSFVSAISADGRYVAFMSYASNLVPGDTNGTFDIFVHNRQTGETEQVSVSSAGEQGNAQSLHPFINADGRYVGFWSDAINLVPGDTNGTRDVFVHDRQTGETERVSVSSAGEQGNDWSSDCSISADGRYVTFASGASNLVPGDTNGTFDIFVRDRQTGETERVSVSSAGEQGNNSGSLYAGSGGSISADGRYVAFMSGATNLVPGDSNGAYDIFVHDRQTRETERVSVSSTGEQGNEFSTDPHISADGRCVVFSSPASNLVPGDTNGGYYQYDVFVHDRQTRETERVSVSSTGEEANYGAMIPFVSADGRYVGFTSDATNLVPGDTNHWWDVFVRDRKGFADVSAEHWAYDEIMACVNANVVQGYPEGTYQPLLIVTRDQMAVYIARALAGGSVPDPQCTTPPFPDVPCDFWARKHIVYCVEQNVVEGYDDGYYRPTEVVTRDQVAVYIARSIATPRSEAGLAGYVPSNPRNFPDVPPTGCGDDGTEPFWAYKHIEYCVEHGVVKGYDDGLYHPDWQVLRDQMAVYVAKAFGLPM